VVPAESPLPESLEARRGSLVGVLGGGQLGMMLAQAGEAFGLRFRFLDPSPDAVAQRHGELIVGSADDLDALARFADGLDYATLEFENVEAEAVAWLAERIPMYPPASALRTAQDRLVEKTMLRDLGCAVPPFEPCASLDELRAVAGRLGTPLVVKTRRFGYDGKGQAVVRSVAELDVAHAAFAGRPLIAEAFVRFRRELSVIAARAVDGSVACFPLVENHHQGGILRRTIAPAPDIDGALSREARTIAHRVLDGLCYVGVLAVELFDLGPDVAGPRLLVNEIAPRVHNSGHWSIEGARTSQFEQHLRAVTGCALGDPSSRDATPNAVMVNLIGRAPGSPPVLDAGGGRVSWHLYGKQTRTGRKVGHATATARSPEAALELAERARGAAGPDDG
jgi:5-(carboxyamino)imidazole ribonucleotide synthase